ncbi:ATP-binding protein [bacterium SCSIO 12696]|nr:ATP-binding protein [bacterium SCSIO 12696]
MKLLSLSFSEFKGQDREWILSDAEFGQVNLIVGKNSTGKTRLLNVLTGLAKLISGEKKGLYQCGTYKASFLFDGEKYNYDLNINDYHVVEEKLVIDDQEVLNRSESGEGVIFAAEIGKNMRFQTPTTELAVVFRRDSIQHPFLEKLYAWGKSTKHYLFGSEFGRNLLGTPALLTKEGSESQDNVVDPNYVVGIFDRAFKKHGSEYKDAVLDDFRALGYDCTDISVANISEYMSENRQLLSIVVQERDLNCITPQIQMSQGMFRALALVIQLNFNIYEKTPASIFVDDIGEGLDYTRSANTILLLIEKSLSNNFQLFMTTNDRFIMNAVDLEYWCILNREGSIVRVYNKSNSPKEFKDFEYIGLSNFDFFSNEYFLGEN